MREGEIGIAFQVTSLHHDLLNVIAVGTNEFAAEAIEGLAELGGAGGFVEFVCAGTKAAIDAIEKNHGRSGCAGEVTLAAVRPLVR